MRFFNHQWSKKNNTIEWNHQSTILSNQSIKIKIWFINCKINCLSIRFYSTNRTISLIVFLFICSTSHFFSTIVRKYLHYNSKYLTKIYVFANQIDAFFFSFKRFFNSISIRSSWILYFCIFLIVELRIFFLWNSYSHMKSD